MGKRGPKKGAAYSSDGVKMVLYRRKHPNAIWADTVRFVYPESHEMDPLDLKDIKIRSARRKFKNFENVFTEQSIANARKWEKFINGAPIRKPLWSIVRKGNGHFCVTYEGKSNKKQYPETEIKNKLDDVLAFWNDGVIAPWMLDGFELDEAALSRAREGKMREVKTSKDILDLRGDEYLHVVSILGEGAELVTQEQMFEQLEIAERTAIAAMVASIEKDKTKS